VIGGDWLTAFTSKQQRARSFDLTHPNVAHLDRYRPSLNRGRARTSRHVYSRGTAPATSPPLARRHLLPLPSQHHFVTWPTTVRGRHHPTPVTRRQQFFYLIFFQFVSSQSSCLLWPLVTIYYYYYYTTTTTQTPPGVVYIINVVVVIITLLLGRNKSVLASSFRYDESMPSVKNSPCYLIEEEMSRYPVKHDLSNSSSSSSTSSRSYRASVHISSGRFLAPSTIAAAVAVVVVSAVIANSHLRSVEWPTSSGASSCLGTR